MQAHANQNTKKENSIKITALSVLLAAALAVAKISGTPAKAQTETRISSEIILVEISKKTVVLGTDLDDQNNRMGFQFTCYPRPKATFHMGFYPSDGSPVALMIQHSEEHQPERYTNFQSGDSHTGFFSPVLEGRRARLAMEAVLTHRSITRNDAGSKITIPQNIDLPAIYETLNCISCNSDFEE